MTFEFEHNFSVEPDTYLKVIGESAFDAFIARELSLRTREVVSEVREGDVLRRTLRVEPERDLPAPLLRVTGGRSLSYREHLVLDLKTATGSWSVEPDLLSGRLTASGTLRISAKEGGCIRHLAGEVRVRIPGLGKLAERFIVAELERSYARSAAATRRWLQERSP